MYADAFLAWLATVF